VGAGRAGGWGGGEAVGAHALAAQEAARPGRPGPPWGARSPSPQSPFLAAELRRTAWRRHARDGWSPRPPLSLPTPSAALTACPAPPLAPANSAALLASLRPPLTLSCGLSRAWRCRYRPHAGLPPLSGSHQIAAAADRQLTQPRPATPRVLACTRHASAHKSSRMGTPRADLACGGAPRACVHARAHLRRKQPRRVRAHVRLRAACMQRALIAGASRGVRARKSRRTGKRSECKPCRQARCAHKYRVAVRRQGLRERRICGGCRSVGSMCALVRSGRGGGGQARRGWSEMVCVSTFLPGEATRLLDSPRRAACEARTPSKPQDRRLFHARAAGKAARGAQRVEPIA